MSTISAVFAREAIDSRGNPTVEVEVKLSDGAQGLALVPSGASTGSNEALELRDHDQQRFIGRGVQKAIGNVRNIIAPEIIGLPATCQLDLDTVLIDLDPSHDKRQLGANSVLAVSIAIAHAAAQSLNKPLYQHLNTGENLTLPVPMLNIINGGKHAKDSVDFQEFMIIPTDFTSFREALRASVEIYQTLRTILNDRSLSTNVGDEGGFAPALVSNREAIELIVLAIERAGYKPGFNCFVGLDIAATELLDSGNKYHLSRENRRLSSTELADLYAEWIRDYPLISIEDGMAEEDWNGWQNMTAKLGMSTQLVGDDLYTTSTDRIARGVSYKASNAVLIKPNQIGTISETLAAIQTAKDAGWGVIISHRSGETEDTTIADLAVATGAGQIKTGAPARGERTAKYNRLLRIEEEMDAKAVFSGGTAYSQLLKGR